MASLTETGKALIDWRGRCFEAAFLLQTFHPHLTLHHGTFIRGPHAWCEGDKGSVYDATYFECWRLEELPPAHERRFFVRVFKAKTLKTYDAEQALLLGVQTGTYGPWE